MVVRVPQPVRAEMGGPVQVQAEALRPARAKQREARNSMPDEFIMQPQQESEWCWAAVSSSVERYFSPTSHQTQCMIARGVLGIAGCCGDATPCNQPARLQDALTLLRR